MIALLISPISNKLKRLYGIDKGLSTLLLSFISVIIVISLASVLTIIGIENTMDFLDKLMINEDNINTMFIDSSNKFFNYINYYEDILNINLKELLGSYNEDLIGFSKNMLKYTIELLLSLPYMIIFIITLFISTYFIGKDIDKIEQKFYNIFTDNVKYKIMDIKNEALYSITGYIRSYIILMGITFLFTWIGFVILKIPYGFILGVLCALLDLIPFLGLTIIFVPIIIYHIFINNKIMAILIFILFLIISLIRQVLEPRLIASNIGINPLASVAAIFIGVQIGGIKGIIYLLGMICSYNILRKVKLL